PPRAARRSPFRRKPPDPASTLRPPSPRRVLPRHRRSGQRRAARCEDAGRDAREGGASDNGPRPPARYGQNDPEIAVGRHNWTFPGSDEGARRAAAVYTLIETAKLNGIDPQAWLADVLARLPDHPMRRVGELLPWQWCGSRRQAA